MAGNSIVLTATDIRGLKAILEWGPANFHHLREENKVKMWMKVYDKVVADKIDVNLSLSEAVKQARQRATMHIV